MYNINKSGSCGVGFVCNTKGIKSHQIVRWGIEAVKNLTHRGAVGADGKTGDGAGILFQLPQKFFLKEIQKAGADISVPYNIAAGVFFLKKECEIKIEEILKSHMIKPVMWRLVPTDDEALGKSALSTKPVIKHLILDMENIDPEKRELCLYIARKHIEKEIGEEAYICSLSCKTIVYKGMLVATHIEEFYPDLQNEDMESAFCLFHQRFSTNTFPEWSLAQPFRVLAHNGEINTIQGNRNWIKAIEPDLWHDIFGDDNELLSPVISDEESDSSSLDRVIELLLHSGYPIEHAINLCIPPAWECCEFNNSDERLRAEAFFTFQSYLMKPWDGPAAIVLTDGDKVCAHLDRNGLRPVRYTYTEDDILILGSETGMIDLGDRKITKRERMFPGSTILVDTLKGRILETNEIINNLSSLKPYREWIESNSIKSDKIEGNKPQNTINLNRTLIAFGYSKEERDFLLKNMALKAKEPTYSMGDDTPLPSLSEKPQLLFRYFKQRFSQVTNPPIDYIREKMVMSLRMNIGYKRNFLVETPLHAKRYRLDSPILLEDDFKNILKLKKMKPIKVSIVFPKRNPSIKLVDAVAEMQRNVITAVKNGAEIVILSDRDISDSMIAIPGLLAVSASFEAMLSEGIANRASLIVETGEARDSHHIAALISYNASAVYPYVALETIKDMCEKGEIGIAYNDALENYRNALEDGLLRTISRLGISTLSSYYGSHLFDTICLNRDFVDKYFPNTNVTLESDGIEEVEKSIILRHDAGFDTDEPMLENEGTIKFRKGGEKHSWSPPSIVVLHKSIKNRAQNIYREFSNIANTEPLFIRHLLNYKKGIGIDIREVEKEENILKRFFSGAMSIGALSPEAHETIAEACNLLCIRSNSGEGGEDPARYNTIKNSSIKQIASGRFGVTPAYLASAKELEIKMAQGAKPGEGGHLPPEKVTEYIAKLRYCVPGIVLISPPPHHDIYSIEDLAQLINDLKEANPQARICVKLVSEVGVGTVAAGVAKAYADIIQISGCDGGTGAASISSIKNAGNYWETGLAETQRVLIENGLREKVTLRVDGGIKTGRDVVIAALLGAEEYGFGTAVMISAGCIMARQCHSNTCPTGIATQEEGLRKRFKAKPDDIIYYFKSVANEVREILADMGFAKFEDIIGRTDLLVCNSGLSLKEKEKISRVKINSFCSSRIDNIPKKCQNIRNNNPAKSMNEIVLNDLLQFIQKAEPVEKEYIIRNTDRSIPVRINYYISKKYGDVGLPDDTIRLIFKGTAGQSFGAFNHKGVSLTLIGEANDYVGKGMFGGRIVIKPEENQEPHKHVIAGNTILYGATGGEFYASGRMGERFAVRNSGAIAVIEGAGQHLCEYMTRGTVVVLGEVGHNVGAGMSGGIIYIYDLLENLTSRINHSYVQSMTLAGGAEALELERLLENHYKYTESPLAYRILNNFNNELQYFKKVVPESIE